MHGTWIRSSILCALIALTSVTCLLCCSKWSPQRKPVELRYFPIDDMAGIITRSHVEIDTMISSDGNGSLRIAAQESTVVRLFETGDVNVENATLIYQARLRTERAEGNVYLEMWCSFPGRGEFFSRGLTMPLTGTTDWTTVEIPFFLQGGQNPDNLKLNLVITGAGTVWVDDVRIIKAPRGL
ncbi:MAG: hypothetical protein NTX17_08655 [Candidatus Eisenbacteria bacterium]|nr:hypothetical protein [Candidatus Eisenbacteria bacterium]